MATTDPRAPWRVRLVALLALACPLGAMAVLISVSGPSGLMILGIGLAGLAAAAAGTWWALSHHGPVRAVGALLAIAAPAVVLVLYTRAGLWLAALAAIALLAAWAGIRTIGTALGAHHPRHARGCLRRSHASSTDHEPEVRRREGRPLRSRREGRGPGRAGHAVGHVHADRCRRPRPSCRGRGRGPARGHAAATAPRPRWPRWPQSTTSRSWWSPCGTRNHFAMDLGLDRDDPSLCLDALTDGEELRVDLGMVSGRAFVNTVSFGVYAQIVQQPEYRDAKTGVALAALPDLLLGFGQASRWTHSRTAPAWKPSRPSSSATTPTPPPDRWRQAGADPGWTSGLWESSGFVSATRPKQPRSRSAAPRLQVSTS